MKLVIQVPCHNEAASLPAVLAELPMAVAGFDGVESLVIDDGSRDGTADVARAAGATHVLRIARQVGLARAYMLGIERCLELGADVIVSTDGDHQYDGRDIPALVAPILEGRADLVIGARPLASTRNLSPLRQWLQGLGSWATRLVSGTSVEDAPSGFRAITRSAAMRLHVFNRYTYTVETIIQAGRAGMEVVSVPVRTNPTPRPSRLVKGTWSYVGRQLLILVRVFVTYKPFRFFAVPGVVALAAGMVIGLRFLYFYFSYGGAGHVQSLILAALLMSVGFLLIVVGFLADLLAVNRVLLEGVEWRLRRLETPSASSGAQAGGASAASDPAEA
jgi:glycosyltransferase involved in cell wall biosynthesis